MNFNPGALWTQFIAEIDDAKKKVSVARSGAWFRGHRSGTWKLSPGLLRYPNGLAREQTLFVEFKNRGGELLKENTKTDWDVLTQMQHYGVPTRLLDWTDRLAVALFFALTGEDDSPCLWVLNPFLLSAKATTSAKGVVFDFGDDPDFGYSKFFSNPQTWPFVLPVPIFPPWKFGRIGQQAGFFTVHGTDASPLDVLAPRFCAKVTIPKDLVEYGRDRLRDDGFDEFAIFRDLDSLGRSIARKYGMLR